LKLKSGGHFHSFYNLVNTYPLAFSEVVRLVAGFVGTLLKYLGTVSQGFQCEEMSRCQIENMEIVSNTSPVSDKRLRGGKLGRINNARRGIVVSEDLQLGIFDTSYGHMGQQW
jgi:hypothetical protein